MGCRESAETCAPNDRGTNDSLCFLLFDLLGYPLIEYAFRGNPEAMTDAVLVSEMERGLPIFTICPMIALYFGSASQGKSGMSIDRRRA